MIILAICDHFHWVKNTVLSLCVKVYVNWTFLVFLVFFILFVFLFVILFLLLSLVRGRQEIRVVILILGRKYEGLYLSAETTQLFQFCFLCRHFRNTCCSQFWHKNINLKWKIPWHIVYIVIVAHAQFNIKFRFRLVWITAVTVKLTFG